MSSNHYKKLGGQTLIYGFGTIVPRLLNYLILTVYYSRELAVQEFGIFTEIYAYISVFMVILTFGMETGFFKFSVDYEKKKLFSTSVTALLSAGIIFICLIFLFIKKIAAFLEYDSFPILIKWAVLIVAVDAVTNLFIAKLRVEEKIKKFIFIQILNVVLTIGLVLFFLEIFPDLTSNYKGKVFYILLANVIASSLRLLILGITERNDFKLFIDRDIIKKLIIYSLPLLLAQLSGIFNESLDRILLRHFLPDSTDKLYELGIYGANIKIAVLMTLFIQMFRYAAEPFYFNIYKEKDSKIIYAELMKYFILFCLLIFLFVLLYLNYFKYFIDKKFHEGLDIVSIMLFAYLLTGVIFNLSIWYKLNNKTYYGIYIIGSGAVLTIILNIIMIPVYGYKGCAITHLITNIFMVILSYIWGQKFYKIPYNIKKILFYSGLALSIYFLGKFTFIENIILETIKNTLLFVIFFIIINKKEKLLSVFIRKAK